jgi:PAS domain-containing protein
MVNLFFANAADKKVTARKGELLEQCRSLLSLAGDTVFEFDRNRRVLFASQQDIVLNSFSDGDVVGKRAAELFPSDISRQLASALDHAEESGNRTTFEFEVNDFRNERWFSADVIAAVLVGEFRYILIVREVSGQRLREKQLLKEGRRLQALYDDLPVLIRDA